MLIFFLVKSVKDMTRSGEDKFARKERHSANPKSSVRGEPKKDGAGGKFTMGRPGDEAKGVQELDKRDPNYDSEEEGVQK